MWTLIVLHVFPLGQPFCCLILCHCIISLKGLQPCVPINHKEIWYGYYRNSGTLRFKGLNVVELMVSIQFHKRVWWFGLDQKDHYSSTAFIWQYIATTNIWITVNILHILHDVCGIVFTTTWQFISHNIVWNSF